MATVAADAAVAADDDVAVAAAVVVGVAVVYRDMPLIFVLAYTDMARCSFLLTEIRPAGSCPVSRAETLKELLITGDRSWQFRLAHSARQGLLLQSGHKHPQAARGNDGGSPTCRA